MKTKNNSLKIIKPKNKSKIPKALRQQVWLNHMGKKFESKCIILWCSNKITVFNFHVGHNIPESKGGTLNINNLFPICSNCNLSMSNNYTIDEWNILGIKKQNILYKTILYIKYFFKKCF
jgi:5-methylcytosine-specific restriction endonuclease McrA